VSNFTYPDWAGLYTADAGMVLLHISEIPGQPKPPNGYVGLCFWILTNGQIPNATVFEVNHMITNTTSAFLATNVIGSIAVTGLWSMGQCGSILYADVINDAILTGVGSTNIRLGTLDSENATLVQRAAFIRMPRIVGDFTADQLGAGGSGPPSVPTDKHKVGRTNWTIIVFVLSVIILSLLMAYMSIIVFSKKKK
jgi:hypothetical protein